MRSTSQTLVLSGMHALILSEECDFNLSGNHRQRTKVTIGDNAIYMGAKPQEHILMIPSSQLGGKDVLYGL